MISTPEVHLARGLVEPAAAVNLFVNRNVLRVRVTLEHPLVVQTLPGTGNEIERFSADDDVRVGVWRNHVGRPRLRRPL